MKTTSQGGSFSFPQKRCAIFIGLFSNLIVAQAQTPDLGTLTDNKETAIKYVAIGSSLSAGVRDGGVYAAAQQTSFPALLAQQMGITNFKQPILDGNGTGKKTVSLDKNGILKFQETKDFDDSKKNAILPKIDIEIDNLAIPYQKVFDIYESDENRVNPLYDNRSLRHLQRFGNSEQNKLSYFDILRRKTEKIDFFTFEFGSHDFVQFIEAGGYARDITYLMGRESMGEERLLRLLTQITSKGVILNVPNYLRFPIFQTYKLLNLKNLTGNSEIFVEHWQKTHVREAQPDDILLPKNSIIDLLKFGEKGSSVTNPLKDEDVLDVEEQRFSKPEGYNIVLAKFAENYKLPIVDIYSLYNRILDGEYLNDEGVTIDISFPNGNFFSADGITPTALGQAIITNEIIKVINVHYGAKIPSLSLKKFL